jgi:hypothetical protein
METRREFRCTRNATDIRKPLCGEDTVERSALFMHASGYNEAAAIMAQRFPAEVADGFTVQLWSLRDDGNGWYFANGLTYRTLDDLRNGTPKERTGVKLYVDGYSDDLYWKEKLNADAA